MQQALLGRGSNRKTAAGGLKEVVLERCACAPQNMEEGGGSQDGNTVSRKGRGRFAPPQSASARGPLNGERAAREAEEVSAACSGDVQRRNKSSQNGGSCISHRYPGVVQAVRESATDSEMDGHGTEARKYPQAGVQSSSSGGYGPGQEFDVAAGGLCTSGARIASWKMMTRRRSIVQVRASCISSKCASTQEVSPPQHGQLRRGSRARMRAYRPSR